MGISFEVFPPKKDGDFIAAFEVVGALASMKPELISVTYGAGGSRSKQTLEIAAFIQNRYHIPAMAHMTCVGSKKEDIYNQCQEFYKAGVGKVLALRGDRPKDMSDEQYADRDFEHAIDLIRYICENTKLEVWGACYPEKHFEAKSLETDITYMKEKQDAGVKAFITQMFFDNDILYHFLDKTAAKGITAPIHAGIMPITAATQLGTSVSLSGASIPSKMANMIAKYADNAEDMKKAGLEYAMEQILDLRKHGINDVHIYTMNKPHIAAEIIEHLYFYADEKLKKEL